MTRALVTALGLFAFGAALLSAQAQPPLTIDRPPEWSLSEGYGFALHFTRGRTHEKALFSDPGISFRLSSRIEYLVEAHFAHYVSPGGYVLGVLPIGGRLYVGSGRVLPYVSLGAGLGWTNLTELAEIDQRFNFLLQGSIGVRRATSETAGWTLEVRLAHVSNAGMARPNLGLNMLVFSGGWRFR
jgi:hypothetical protein